MPTISYMGIRHLPTSPSGIIVATKATSGMKANIVSSKEISITWSTTASSRFDNHTRGELHDLNYHGWATTLNLTRPEN